MQQFYGTKLIAAKPMTRAEYNNFRGWKLPDDESGADAGYLVEYLDGGKPNVEGYEGYVSWSPKEQFDNAYQPTDAMSFGHAIVALKAGKKVARAGWNGKGMYLIFVPATVGIKFGPNTPYGKAVGTDTLRNINAHIDMKTANGDFQPGWLASQTDKLANDWMIVD